MAESPVTHDYTRQGWGQAFEALDAGGPVGKYAGHGPLVGPKIKVGDLILTKMASGRLGR
jgi:hypothetical protein